jgi:hypothetical protein
MIIVILYFILFTVPCGGILVIIWYNKIKLMCTKLASPASPLAARWPYFICTALRGIPVMVFDATFDAAHLLISSKLGCVHYQYSNNCIHPIIYYTLSLEH